MDTIQFEAPDLPLANHLFRDGESHGSFIIANREINHKAVMIFALMFAFFVLMFIPVESAFMLAIEKDNEIFRKAFDQNIMIVSPSTLLVTLRTLACLLALVAVARPLLVRLLSVRAEAVLAVVTPVALAVALVVTTIPPATTLVIGPAPTVAEVAELIDRFRRIGEPR